MNDRADIDSDTKLLKHSLVVAGHRTSISLEGLFWTALRDEAARQGVSIADLVRTVDAARSGANLSSALRVYLLRAALARRAQPTEGGSR